MNSCESIIGVVLDDLFGEGLDAHVLGKGLHECLNALLVLSAADVHLQGLEGQQSLVADKTVGRYLH